MKLVCFSNNTGGGLVCDLLNGHSSPAQGYRLNSPEHNIFKIGDVPGVQWSVDIGAWLDRCDQHRNHVQWMGTHLHPRGIPNLDDFQQVVVITTERRTSRRLRWLRYYHGWFRSEFPHWQESSDLHDIDRVRELAKNTLVPYPAHAGCWNVEFADLVSGEFVANNNLDYDYYWRWRESNSFLMSPEDSWASQRFDEAEWEQLHQKPYRYI